MVRPVVWVGSDGQNNYGQCQKEMMVKCVSVGENQGKCLAPFLDLTPESTVDSPSLCVMGVLVGKQGQQGSLK